MRLNVKSSIGLLLAVLLAGCGGNENSKKPENRERADSVKKAAQRRAADSLKAGNPLLIVPPDSGYTGTYIDRYPSGIVKFRGFFRQGKRHGQWMSFYPDGGAWSEMHYERGLRHGPNVTFYTNGRKRYEGLYKSDQRDSVWTYYDSTGAVAKKVTFLKGDIVNQQ